MKFRNEHKHYVNEIDLAGLRSRLLTIAKRDRFGGKTGIYKIKSLYFDNCYDKALFEKQGGLNKREKFRIRFYNDDAGFIRLEKKSKFDGYCLKQSLPLSKKKVIEILEGKFDWIQGMEGELFYELYAKMRYQLLRPKNVVVYEREAFVYNPGNVRVTIDSNIRGSDDVMNFFDSKAPMKKLLGQSILEVKWDEFLPSVMRDAVQLYGVKTTSFSKYAATRFSAF